MRRQIYAVLLALACVACGGNVDGNGDNHNGDSDASVGADLADTADLAGNNNNSPDLAGNNSNPDLAGPSGCGPCNTPPTQCHAPVGTCQANKCVYALVNGLACDDGDPCTLGDVCAAGACAGTPRVCDGPPAAMCLSSTKLLTYDKVGACNAGACIYTQHQLTCGSGGCVANACATNPCSGITCNTPPSPTCFKAAGLCSGTGQCSYAYDDGATCNDGDPCTEADQCNTGLCKGSPKSCLAPPADTCENASTLRVYDPVGVCGAGACSYTYRFVTCPTGCASAHCNTSAWTAMTTGVSVSLRRAWGASATDVFAVGDQGTIIHYNGSNWKTMTQPSGVANFTGVDGTAGNNVFAITDGNSTTAALIRWDGTSWKKRADIPCYDFCCVGAVGSDDAFTWDSGGTLRRVTGGTVTTAASFTVGTTLFHTCDVRVLSSTDVYVAGGATYHYNGSALTEVKAPATTSIGAYGMVAFGPTQLLSFAYSSVFRWDGMQWLTAPTGNAGVQGLGGTSFTRVFAAGYAYLGNGVYQGSVSFWDGSGWAGEPVAAGLPNLNGVWAATTGPVFVVGDKGTILTAIH